MSLVSKDGFIKASNTFYKKPEGGSKQDNFTKDDIKKQLEGFTRIQPEKLQHIPIGTHIKYFNHKEKKFRCGGRLAKASSEYIMLKNYYKKLVWSVQVKDNYFFIPETTESSSDIKTLSEKDRLYELYKAGKLSLKE